MMKTKVVGTKLLAVVTLVGSIGLLQYHSIQFWSNNIDQTTGVAWSVILEFAVLWLWSIRNVATRMLGVIGSLVLLAGPVYQVASPLLTGLDDGRQVDEMKVRVVPMLQSEIVGLEGQLKTYLANSEERAGWLPIIQQTQSQLDEKRTKLVGLIQTKQNVTTVSVGKAHVVIMMEVVVLLILQLTNIMAIVHLVSKPTVRKRRR